MRGFTYLFIYLLDARNHAASRGRKFTCLAEGVGVERDWW